MGSRADLQATIERQKEQLVKYQTKLRGKWIFFNLSTLAANCVVWNQEQFPVIKHFLHQKVGGKW